MKLLLLVLLVLCVSLSYGKLMRKGKPVDKGPSVWKTPDDKQKTQRKSEVAKKQLESLPDDFDKETEDVMNALEMSRGLHKKQERKGARVSNRQHMKKGKKVADESLTTSRKCQSMKEKADLICENVKIAFANPLVRKMYTKRTRKARSGWMECCGLESAEDRLSCFVDIKIAKLDKLCHTSRSPQFNKCCKESRVDRLNCFDEYKKSACNSQKDKFTSEDNSKEDDIEMIRERKPNTRVYSRINIKKQNVNWRDDLRDMKKSRAGAGIPYRKHFWRGQRRDMKKDDRKQCCHAGKSFTPDNETSTALVCEIHFEKWDAEQNGTASDLCHKKFIYCCMNEPKVSKDKLPNERQGKKWFKKQEKLENRNIEVDPTSEEEVSIEQPVEETPEIPDETGQEVIQTMMVTLPMAPEPHRKRDCCTEGTDKGRTISWPGSKHVCYQGLQLFKRRYPKFGMLCHNDYMRCCMIAQQRPAREDNYQQKDSQAIAENEYDKKLGKFPGLRKSKNGGYYFVDFVNPDGLMKKPQEKY